MAPKPKRVDPRELDAAILAHGRYVTYPVAAEMTGASVRTLKRLVARGELPMYTIGRTRTYRLKTEDVLGLVRQVA